MKKKKPLRKRKHHGHSHKNHCVVKRASGKCEGYDERKLYRSIYTACYVAQVKGEKCGEIANAVAKFITIAKDINNYTNSSVLRNIVSDNFV